MKPRGPKPRDLRERFESKVHKTDGCWLWTGHVSHDGYGQIHMKQAGGGWQLEYAHRVAYVLYIGPLSPNLTVDHVKERGCANRACVNPAHLEAVTNAVNIHRGDTPQARNRAKTHCPQGHPYDQENTMLYGGKRSCRTCHRTRMRRYAAAKRREAAAR